MIFVSLLLLLTFFKPTFGVYSRLEDYEYDHNIDCDSDDILDKVRLETLLKDSSKQPECKSSILYFKDYLNRDIPALRVDKKFLFLNFPIDEFSVFGSLYIPEPTDNSEEICLLVSQQTLIRLFYLRRVHLNNIFDQPLLDHNLVSCGIRIKNLAGFLDQLQWMGWERLRAFISEIEYFSAAKNIVKFMGDVKSSNVQMFILESYFSPNEISKIFFDSRKDLTKLVDTLQKDNRMNVFGFVDKINLDGKSKLSGKAFHSRNTDIFELIAPYLINVSEIFADLTNPSTSNQMFDCLNFFLNNCNLEKIENLVINFGDFIFIDKAYVKVFLKDFLTKVAMKFRNLRKISLRTTWINYCPLDGKLIHKIFENNSKIEDFDFHGFKLNLSSLPNTYRVTKIVKRESNK